MATSAVHDPYLAMPFMSRLLDSSASHRGLKRQRSTRHRHTRSDSQMALFATRFLAPPSRKSKERKRDDIDEYLSSDLEASFASNVSLNSPPRRHAQLSSDCDAMDISPMPPQRHGLLNVPSSKPASRPRALTTSSSRLFGSDISNSSPSLLPSPKFPEGKLSTNSGTASGKKLQRAALPVEWMSAMRSPEEPEKPTIPTQPSSPMDDAMDVDTSYHLDPEPVFEPVNFSPEPKSAVPTVTGFNNLFFDTLSPRRSFESPRGPTTKKRRSFSPESNRAINKDADSSPGMLASSPSDSRLDRVSNAATSRNGKPTLQGLGAPALFMKRGRRPVLSEMIQPSDFDIHSAHPDMSSGLSQEESSPAPAAPPVRRAFSALLPPSIYAQGESDSSFDGPDMSSPAQAYAKRQQVKTIRRCDGTEDFRPLTGASALVMKDSPSRRFLAPGLPGFGDNEAHGKILPCHRVTEDGLMRISVPTLDDLLDGKYDDQIHDYHVIDCRFDYEYAGGHIRGAVNINTTTAVEELLLGPSLTKPKPSVSGDSTRKTILVFHCEFSAKRAPTFAKHLRARDRAMNNHVYPKIHYPEVYILEGGYCNYFKTSGRKCEPNAYVTMDDPNHALSRQQDLDQFRKAKFGRHKSYAYGDGPLKNALSQQLQPKRNTAPAGLFAAGNAARTRRAGTVSLGTLAEDANTTAETGDDTDTDLGDSPCPPPNKVAALKMNKKPLRHLVRSETYGPTRMPLNFH
ncbi:tyrosine phosphatase [Coprinopsis cinerea okayama7|uniref:M-phase inducer phosphatase n=1 Tax=Coprinopsis cinerea (strain Okayama-7 / 130 / ATCC MYA-4618 / FGSC 9003) TaxID=240176 RepID=A8NH68_COPC7|nr:tyrosine phosphatase [Coprinopsis cinerea okayama7\|eukprot:XP_001833696.1 tyrosine phosphatase [Coprinopsis cinerea okayama7\